MQIRYGGQVLRTISWIYSAVIRSSVRCLDLQTCSAKLPCLDTVDILNSIAGSGSIAIGKSAGSPYGVTRWRHIDTLEYKIIHSRFPSLVAARFKEAQLREGELNLCCLTLVRVRDTHYMKGEDVPLHEHGLAAKQGAKTKTDSTVLLVPLVTLGITFRTSTSRSYHDLLS